APAEPLQLSLHYVIVLVEQLTPSAVAQVADMLAGAHDVGEQDGGQYSFRFRHVAHTRQELLDLICHAVGSPTPAAGPWDLDVPRRGNLASQALGLRRRGQPVNG